MRRFLVALGDEGFLGNTSRRTGFYRDGRGEVGGVIERKREQVLPMLLILMVVRPQLELRISEMVKLCKKVKTLQTHQLKTQTALTTLSLLVMVLLPISLVLLLNLVLRLLL